jgi:hypothetical protein
MLACATTKNSAETVYFEITSLYISVIRDDVVVPIHENRVRKSELAQTGAKLQNLFLAVGAGIVHIWYQLVDADLFKSLRPIYLLKPTVLAAPRSCSLPQPARRRKCFKSA